MTAIGSLHLSMDLFAIAGQHVILVVIGVGKYVGQNGCIVGGSGKRVRHAECDRAGGFGRLHLKGVIPGKSCGSA
jgi:hypothetical protein